MVDPLSDEFERNLALSKHRKGCYAFDRRQFALKSCPQKVSHWKLNPNGDCEDATEYMQKVIDNRWG